MGQSNNQFLEYFEYFIELFQCLEPKKITDLLSTHKQNLLAFIFKFLDCSTKRDIRKETFRFILLKLIDSYDDYSNIDKDLIILFNYALDYYPLNMPQISKSYFIEVNQSSKSNNEFQQLNNTYGDLQKLFKEKDHIQKIEEQSKVA